MCLISWGQMDQVVAIVAVCPLTILTRMPTPLLALTLFWGLKKTAHRGREQVAVQNEAIKRKILQIQETLDLPWIKTWLSTTTSLSPDAIAILKVHDMSYLSSISNNTPATTQAVQPIRASLSKPCFQKLVGIEACHAKQTRGDNM